MPHLKYFKSQKRTNRFNKNQKVFIRLSAPNHMWIRFKFRGKGRYVNGIIRKYDAPEIGEIKEIEVGKEFYKRILGENVIRLEKEFGGLDPSF